MNQKVSCIIPAYNEEKTVKGVVEVCLKTPEIEEVIVVSDGSTDKTVKQAKSLKKRKVKVIELKENHGKGFAVVEGLRKAKNSIVLFLDADLINLKPHFLSSLIWPVLNRKADMAIAHLKEKKFKSLPLRMLSGQRCLRSKPLKLYLKEIQKSKYGLEILLNEIFKKKILFVPWVNEKPLYLRKMEKADDRWMAFYIKEAFDITSTFLKNKTKKYRRKFLEKWIKTMASYFKVRVEKIKEILEV